MTSTLDRRQREALRDELVLRANGYGDFKFAFESGDREYVRRNVDELRRMIDAMDAIGWTEQDGTPEHQPVRAGRLLVSWARRKAKEVARSCREEVPADRDLDAYAALCAIGGDA